MDMAHARSVLGKLEPNDRNNKEAEELLAKLKSELSSMKMTMRSKLRTAMVLRANQLELNYKGQPISKWKDLLHLWKVRPTRDICKGVWDCLYGIFDRPDRDGSFLIRKLEQIVMNKSQYNDDDDAHTKMGDRGKQAGGCIQRILSSVLNELRDEFRTAGVAAHGFALISIAPKGVTTKKRAPKRTPRGTFRLEDHVMYNKKRIRDHKPFDPFEPAAAPAIGGSSASVTGPLTFQGDHDEATVHDETELTIRRLMEDKKKLQTENRQLKRKHEKDLQGMAKAIETNKQAEQQDVLCSEIEQLNTVVQKGAPKRRKTAKATVKVCLFALQELFSLL